LASYRGSGDPSTTPKREEDKHWFLPLARFLGPAYLRNAFTKGTEQEIEFLVGALGLVPGQRVLDAGCGPGRHALALVRRGFEVLGVDLSAEFIGLAREAAAREDLPARFEVVDVRGLTLDTPVDAAICLCQGGFGLLGGPGDVDAFHAIARVVRPGGGLAVSAFSTAFVLRHLEPGESFNVATGVLHEVSIARDSDGRERDFDLWTTCFTPRELELLAASAGITARAVHGVTPGRYRAAPPTIADPELLLIGRRTAPVDSQRAANPISL
jgi:SAM-dependent methyltransferase